MKNSESEFLGILANELQKRQIWLEEEKLWKLGQHYQMVKKWGKVHNLTKISGVKESVFLHYLDCVIGLQYLDIGDEIADLGSGAGFPGLIAAVMWPEKRILLIESSRKKCSFLKLVCHQLKLQNTIIINKNFLDISSPKLVISRATVSPSAAKKITEHLSEGTTLACWLSAEDHKEWVRRCMSWGLEYLETHPYMIQPGNNRTISIFRKLCTKNTG